ncbi:MAG: hypothetical protein RL653_170 [Pseudomonadota bacterium]|jgi:hypothetical protein
MRLLFALPLSLLASGCFDSLTSFPRDAGAPPSCTEAQLASDVDNCGTCGNRCPAPLHARAVCRAGKCGRGPCEREHYDIDGAATFGCESTCAGAQCRLPNGQSVTLSVPAVHDLDAAAAVPSGSAFGSKTSSNTTYRHEGGFKGASP